MGLLILGIVDLVRPCFIRNRGARYFVLHTVANAMISVACVPDLQRALVSPVDALVGPTLTVFPMAIIASIHLYHALFFGLSREDIFHHVQFVAPLWVLAVVFKWDGGASQNFGAFFICGLPGGLNYAALVGVKEGWLSSLSQKRFDAWINACLRAPGCIVYACLQWQVWLADSRPTRGWSKGWIDFFTLLVTFLMAFNGVYYMEQSIGNYHAARVKALVQSSVEPGVFQKIFPKAGPQHPLSSSPQTAAALGKEAATPKAVQHAHNKDKRK